MLYSLSILIIIFLMEILWMLILYIIVKKYARVKFFFAMTVIVLNLIYIIWRIKYTIPTTSKIGMTIGIILISSELLGFFQSTIYSILFYKPYKLKEMKMDDLSKLPTIDVMIMTYNEPSYVLRKTIAGCLNIEYPDNLLNIYINQQLMCCLQKSPQVAHKVIQVLWGEAGENPGSAVHGDNSNPRHGCAGTATLWKP